MAKDRLIVVIIEAYKEGPAGNYQNNRKEYEPEHQFAQDNAEKAQIEVEADETQDIERQDQVQ